MNYGNRNKPITIPEHMGGLSARVAFGNTHLTGISLPDRQLPVLIPWGGRVSTGDTDNPATGSFVVCEMGAEPSEFSYVLRTTGYHLSRFWEARKEFERQYGAVPEKDVKCLRLLNELAEAIRSRSLAKLKRCVVLAVGPEISKDSSRLTTIPMSCLAAMINASQVRSRPIVWNTFEVNESDEGLRLGLGILCADVTSALYMLTLAEIGDPGLIGSCARCGATFFRKRDTKRFCSGGCRSAAAMARMRAREKKKPRAKKSAS